MNIRPYVVCHVFVGLNGRIDGAYMLDPAASPARAAYSRMQVEFGADAVAYGAVTTKGFVGSRPLALGTHRSAPKGDFVAPHAERSFYVSVDPAGEIAWESALPHSAPSADGGYDARRHGALPLRCRGSGRRNLRPTCRVWLG